MQRKSAAEERTPEQHAAVRRRSSVVALCGAFIGLSAIVMLLARTLDADHPPFIIAVNFSFCALMMGVGILVYTRGTSGVRVAVFACIVAIISGFAGTLVYARQAMQWRRMTEHRELANVQAIATGSLRYARRHDGQFPPDLLAMLRDKDLSLDNIHGAVSAQKAIGLNHVRLELGALGVYDDLERYLPVDLSSFRKIALDRLHLEVDALADYQYLGMGLQLPSAGPGATQPAPLPEEILIAASTNTVLGRQAISVAYANGQASFLEQGAAEAAVTASNDARASLGFPSIRPPDVIVRSREEARKASPSDNQ